MHFLHLKYLKGEIPIMNLSQMTKDQIVSFKSENEKLYNDFKDEISKEDLTDEQKKKVIELLDNDIAHYGKYA